MKATHTTSTPRRTDNDLLVLGEALTEMNKRLGDDALDEVARDRLTARWFEIIDTMTAVEAQSSAGKRVKAGAIIIYFARTGDIHKLALSLAGDILASS